MNYESYKRKATIITGEGEVTLDIEHRRDPLTKRISSICPDLKEKWSSFVGETDRDLIKTLAEDSASWCPFCQSIEEVTPEVSFAPQGRWHIGDVWVFPNLFPRTAFEAVITSPKNHFLWLDEFSQDFVETHLRAGMKCILDVFSAEPSLSHAVIGWNYLPPAGASLVHPHMQISMRDIQFNYPAYIEKKSKDYFQENGSNYWYDILCEERHIKTIHRTEWITPFAPTGFNEIWGLIPISHFGELTELDISSVAKGVHNILQFYGKRGCSAFNMLIYSGALDSSNEYFVCGVRLISRSNVRPLYLNIDSWYMPRLLWEEIVAESPEELADAAKSYFT